MFVGAWTSEHRPSLVLADTRHGHYFSKEAAFGPETEGYKKQKRNTQTDIPLISHDDLQPSSVGIRAAFGSETEGYK